MIRDERGLPLSTDNTEAAALFDRPAERVVRLRRRRSLACLSTGTLKA